MNSPTPDEVNQVRINAGLSQSKAADLLYVTKNTWQKWEYGNNPMPPALWEHFHCKSGQNIP